MPADLEPDRSCPFCAGTGFAWGLRCVCIPHVVPSWVDPEAPADIPVEPKRADVDAAALYRASVTY